MPCDSNSFHSNANNSRNRSPVDARIGTSSASAHQVQGFTLRGALCHQLRSSALRRLAIHQGWHPVGRTGDSHLDVLDTLQSALDLAADFDEMMAAHGNGGDVDDRMGRPFEGQVKDKKDPPVDSSPRQ